MKKKFEGFWRKFRWGEFLKIRHMQWEGAAEEQLSAAPLAVACTWLVLEIFFFFVFQRKKLL